MRKTIYFSLFLSLFISSCVTIKTTRYTVASAKADCVGVAPQECMLIKKGEASDWQFFYNNIDGFSYKEGYEYVLDVKEEPLKDAPADASSIRYILIREVSKEFKNSVGLPPSTTSLQNYQCVGKVISAYTQDIGKGASLVVEVLVTSSTNADVEEGDTIYCELLPTTKVKPSVGREYVFKARHKHPAHAKDIYLLETDVMDLVR